jgi:hypothetical protein
MQTRVILGTMLLLGIGACQGAGTVPNNPNEAEPVLTPSAVQKCSQGEPNELYAPSPSDGSMAQALDLWKAHDYANALKLLALATTPHAAWFITGTPDDVRKAVHQTMMTAESQHRIPVLGACCA